MSLLWKVAAAVALVAAAALIEARAESKAVFITVPIASWHAERQREKGKGMYNQENWGLGLEYAYSEKLRLGAGIYRNSLRQDTGYFGVAYFPLYLQSANLRLGSSVGVVSGYTSNLMPIAVPTAAMEWKRFGVNALFVPPYDGNPAGVGIQIKFRLD